MAGKSLKIFSFIVRFIGIFLILFTLLAFTDAVINLLASKNFGTIGADSDWAKDSDSLLIVTGVQKDSPPSKAGIQKGDTLIKINGQFINKSTYQKILGEPRIGEKYTASVKKGDTLVTYELEFIPSTFFEKFIELLFRIIPASIMILYTIVGLYGLLKSPYSKETMIIAMFCFSFGCFMYSVIGFSTEVNTFITDYLYFKYLKTGVLFLSLFATSFWLLIFATFPKRFTFLDSNKFVSYTYIFLLPFLVMISSTLKIQLPVYIVFPLLFVNMILGVLLLKFSMSGISNALQLRQVRLMFLGIKYGAVAIIVGWASILLSEAFFGISSSVYSYAAVSVFLVSQVGGLIIPFTFLNSFFQNRLLETESALRKRIRYIGVTLIMLVLYLSTIFVIGRVWINMFDVTDPTLIIILVLFVSLTFTPINKKILKWLDEKFYPERTKYTDSLKQFIQNIAGFIESDELLAQLSKWAVSTTGIIKAIPVLAGFDNSAPVPFNEKNSDSVINRIKDGTKFFWDEISDRSRDKVNPDEFEWAYENNISVTIPMLSRGQLIGALNVGRKIHEDDFSVEDLDILTQASYQTALALQNIKLQSEYIDKKRMNKELEMARNIQKRLMPHDIPAVPGLDIVGECHPCYEIAGDYFDIINIEGGYSVMVVADVSGKGAGAAMIMANLQASIRLGVHLSDKLADFVARINELIYNNTSSSEFITFFMSIWDPTKNVLYYVNAGHNPPVVIDIDGKVTRLPATGLMLGVLSDSAYEENYVRLEKGSVFVIYTDGLEEAMNEKDEMFGGDRIISTVEENKSQSPEKILRSLRDSVLAHCGTRPIQDDVTMIVGKVK